MLPMSPHGSIHCPSLTAREREAQTSCPLRSFAFQFTCSENRGNRDLWAEPHSQQQRDPGPGPAEIKNRLIPGGTLMWFFKRSSLAIAHRPIIRSRVVGCFFSGIDKIAEDKIARWLKEGGEENLRRHRGKLQSDPHQHIARTLNLQEDYVHSKILADNKILPKSIELRLQLDKQWEELKADLQSSWNEAEKPELQSFLKDPVCLKFQDRMAALDQLAKRINNAIIEDSMRFHGRSPVRHAKGYKFEERVSEALELLLKSKGNSN